MRVFPNVDTVKKSFDHFIFDVDRTIAPNGQSIADDFIGLFSLLLESNSIALISARGIEEDLDRFSKALFQRLDENKFYQSFNVFSATGAQCYLLNRETGILDSIFDLAKDEKYQLFHDKYRDAFGTLMIETVDDIQYDETENDSKVKIHDRGAQVTLFFSHIALRQRYIHEYLKKHHDVTYVKHARNVLHVIPKEAGKDRAVNFLLKDSSKKALVFADGFHELPNGYVGNDLALAELPSEKVTCISVGNRPPKAGSGVWYDPNASQHEYALTASYLNQIIQGCSFDQLSLCQGVSDLPLFIKKF